jgi:hypothetical protein
MLRLSLLFSKQKLKGIIEKKTFINLVEGFAVSLKHYLRGGGYFFFMIDINIFRSELDLLDTEHGIYYEDLYREVFPSS